MSSLLSARQEIGRRDLETLRSNFGQLVCSRLDDPAVTDVMLNDDGMLYVSIGTQRGPPIGMQTGPLSLQILYSQ
jgi:Flp pilus assembly CpaF family ATPase